MPDHWHGVIAAVGHNRRGSGVGAGDLSEPLWRDTGQVDVACRPCPSERRPRPLRSAIIRRPPEQGSPLTGGMTAPSRRRSSDVGFHVEVALATRATLINPGDIDNDPNSRPQSHAFAMSSRGAPPCWVGSVGTGGCAIWRLWISVLRQSMVRAACAAAMGAATARSSEVPPAARARVARARADDAAVSA